MTLGQQMLFQFQKQRFIDSENSEDPEENHQFQHLIESPVPFIKINALSKMKKQVQSLVGQELSWSDKQLLYGIYNLDAHTQENEKKKLYS